MTKNTTPRFRVDKKKRPPEVWLQCSDCGVDIREVKPTESVNVTIAYYCDGCDDGAVHINQGSDHQEE